MAERVDSNYAGVEDDGDIATDADLEHLHQNEHQLSLSISSDAVDDQNSDAKTDGRAFDDEWVFDLAAAGRVDKTSLSSFEPLMFDDKVGEEMASLVHDNGSVEATSNTSVLDDPVNALVWSALHDAFTEGAASEDLVTDDATNDLMWSMITDALSKRAESEPVDFEDTLDDMVRTMLDAAFFGPAASKGAFSLYEEKSVEGDAGRSDDAFTRQVMSEPDGDDEMSVDVVEAIHDEIRSMLHSRDLMVTGSEWPLELADANGVVEGIRLGPFGPMAPDSVLDDKMMSVPMHDALGDDTTYMLTDAMSDGDSSKAVILDDAVSDLIRSVLNDAYARGESEDRMLDDDMDELMWAKLHHAICGREASGGVNLEDTLDETLTSLLHDAFFGPAASTAVSALATNACICGLVIEDYVQTVYELYGKFEEVRNRTVDDSALEKDLSFELAIYDVFDEPRPGPLGPMMLDEDAADDVMGSVPNYSDDSSTFDEEWLFDLADDRAVNGISLWPFGPALSEDAVDNEMPLVLRDAMSDWESSKAVRVLVWSVLDDAFTVGVESEGLIVDDTMDELMWSELHDTISFSGRAASEPKNIGDVFDDVFTSLLHDAFFGSAASKAIESLTTYADDRELVVETYVQALSERYDMFKEARSHNPDSEAPVVPQAGKRGWTWVKKLWKRIRRKGQG